MVTVLGKLLPVTDFTNTFFFTRIKNYFSYNGGSDNHSSYNIWFLVRLIVQIVYHTNQSAIKQGRLLSRVSATCFITVNNERKAYIVWCRELIRQTKSVARSSPSNRRRVWSANFHLLVDVYPEGQRATRRHDLQRRTMRGRRRC